MLFYNIGKKSAIAANDQLSVQIRGSADCWSLRCSDIEAVDETFGPATFFITLSCNESNWPDMVDNLRALYPNLKSRPLSAVKGSFSYCGVGIADQFHRRWRAFEKRVLRNPSGPLGHVRHFVASLEMQQRLVNTLLAVM
jgi:hypothetical protein